MAEETLIEDDVKKKAPLRPPNRRRHEEQLEQLMSRIRSLEAELKSLGRPQHVDGLSEDSDQKDVLLTEQKRLREEKEASISKRKSLDEDLKAINEQISKQNDALSKIDAGLQFKREAAVDDAIHKLEHQLKTRHFKLSEENRIVKEIDSLRRSKKKVIEYQQQKQQIESLRARKKTVKDERDKYFRLVSSLKTKEDEVKQHLKTNKSKIDEAWNRYREAGPKREALKKEIDELYERRRQLTAEFRQQNSKYHIQQKQQRADSFRRKEEEKRALEEARKKEWQDYEASRQPYEDERQLCAALIKYLQRYLTPDQELPLVQSPTVSVSSAICGRDEESVVNYVILKKKTNDNDAFLPTTSAKKKRAIRKHNRKSSYPSKPISHTPSTFSQFETLGLRAPSYMSEVSDAIDQLIAKKEEYENACKGASSASQRALGAAAGQETSTTSTFSSSALAHQPVMSNIHVDSHGSNEAYGSSRHFNLMKLASKLPRIDVQSAQDHTRQQQANSTPTPGVESAPETPNSEGSAPREADGDLESVDSGIGIQRSKGFTSALPPTRIKQDDKYIDTRAKIYTSPDRNDQEPVSQVPSTTHNALPQSHDPTEEYIEEGIASILEKKQAPFSHSSDLMVQET
ncbi:stress response protein NST1-like isoform X2 [Acanthaster planci]|uniref:Stress response protein NST1-like isoform X2 n=1 Tax=Acanthaster planci TaxID=133434 RepID=A0A8B7ZFH4_ACAPL|nr:stress response protein NST1-like isoform X2 [Acanthaster planci]